MITGGPHVGKTVIQSAQLQGYNVVFDAASLDAANGDRVLGLFNAGNMSLEWNGLQAMPFPGSGAPGGPDVRRESAAGQRTVARRHDGEGDRPARRWGRAARPTAGRGFFLQVEGASIDKQDHVEAPCQQIGETIAFDRAIRVGLEFAKTHPDTLIIVTADHAHTSQIVPVPGNEPLGRPGTLSTLLTKGDRSLMTVNYAHAAARAIAGPHRIAKCGSPRRVRRRANVVGVTNQTDLFHTMARALGLE